MYTNSIAKYHDSLHISMTVSLSPFINKRRFDNSVVSFRIFTSMLAGDTRHHWLGRPPGFGRCQMQSHSTTGLRLSVSQFDLASRYKTKLLHACFLKEYGGGVKLFKSMYNLLSTTFPKRYNQMIKQWTNYERKYYSIGYSLSWLTFFCLPEELQMETYNNCESCV